MAKTIERLPTAQARNPDPLGQSPAGPKHIREILDGIIWTLMVKRHKERAQVER